MWKDPIVEEVRKNRDRIARQKGYSLKRIFQDAQKTRSKIVSNSRLPRISIKKSQNPPA